MKSRLVVGISGATGFVYGARALSLLKKLGVETHLVVTKAAHLTRIHETGYSKEELESLASVVYKVDDVGAAIASGSFETMGMLVAPCSIRTLAAVAGSFSDNLLTRAADVTLKERRRLVLMVREAPLNLAHIRNMEQVTLMGGVIFPPVPAMYQNISSVDELVTCSMARALALFGLDVPGVPKWGEGIGLGMPVTCA